MRHNALLCLLALLALTALPVLAETMYARFSAPVRSERTLRAATLGTLEQGEPVEVASKVGRYFKVSYKGGTGWVYFNKLSTEKPEDVAALLGGGFGTEGILLTDQEAGGALRGLSRMTEDYAARSSEIPQWTLRAVEQMQARRVSGQELELFQKEGKLGEYGEEAAR
ncbi:MAG: SH3 domain-containing protein [Candidatus Brocadiae bacterium]|nr:SH3 domain-containing protein [Candidatus Brocadiia bacterium]